MVRRIVGAGLQRQALVLVVAAAVVAVGFVQLGGTRVETLPEFTPPFVEVQTEALGLSAHEVEQLITVPLEADLLNGVAWMEEIRSQSLPGLSSIVMTFEPGTDLLAARQFVQERLTQAAGLPNVSRAPSMVQPLSSEGRVMMIGLSSDDLSLVDLSVLARWTVRPKLMGVDGVANVTVWGQRRRQLQVRVDPADLAAADITLLDVVKTTGNALWVSPLSFLEASTPGVGGFIDGPNQRVGVRHVLSITEPEDLEAVTIDGQEGLTLGEVSTVVEDHQPLIGDAVVAEGDGLYLIVEKFPWSNTADTTRAVEAALDDLAPGLTGVEVNADLFRPASYLERSIDNVQRTAIVGFIVLAAVLALISLSWRATVVELLSLLVTFLGTGLVLYFTDTTVNFMVLAGMAAAAVLVVGDVVTDVDSVSTGLSARQGEEVAEDSDGEAIGQLDETPVSRRERLIGAVQSVRTPLMFATAALVVAIIPPFVMGGAAGEFLPTVGLTVALTLAVSIAVSLIVTPALCDVILARNPATSRGASEAWISTMHDRFADQALTKSLVAGVLSIVLVGVSLVMIPLLDSDFVPEFQQTDVIIEFEGAAGSSLNATRRIAVEAAGELGALPGVSAVGAHVGRAVLSDSVSNVNSSELWLQLDPDADYDSTVDAVRAVVDGYPGVGIPRISSYSNRRVDDVLRQPTEDFVLRVYGEDRDTLVGLSAELTGLVDSVSGTSNVEARVPIMEPTIEIEVDIEQAAEFEIKPGDVRRAAATLLSGIEVGSFFEEQKVFEVIVWSPPELRSSITDVGNLLVDAPNGDRVRLGDVAAVRIAPNEAVIERDAVSRYVDIVADVSGRSRGAVEDDVTAAIRTRGLPFEYHTTILSDASDAGDTKRRSMAVIAAVAITIYLILQAAFSSWRLSTLLVLATAASTAGSLVAVVLAGGDFSIGSSIGVFVVAALTLRMSVWLLGRLEQLQLENDEELDLHLVKLAASSRVLPALTAYAAILALMVTIIAFGDIAGQEIIRPMAQAVTGGLVSSALVTLFVVPALYARYALPATPHESLLTV